MFRITDIIPIIKFGLENPSSINAEFNKIHIKDLTIINEDTLCCEFYPYAKNTNDIKVEIVTIMSFFNGFFRNDGFEGISFRHYAVRAFDTNNTELLNAISSKETAEFLGKGNSIDWLKSTFFQENTDDYRLAQAKRIIAEIENCLRELIKKILNKHFGNNWWHRALDNKLGKEVKQIYLNQFGITCNDGNILVSYTYILQLKKIITTHFNLFKPYFGSLIDFENQIDALNLIRREEAHNRHISETNLKDLDKLHESLTTKIFFELTTLQSGFLTENWRLKIKKIMKEKEYHPIHNEQEILKETDLYEKFIKTTQNKEHLILYLDNIIIKLKSIVAPVHKKITQRELINILEKYKDLQLELLKNSFELNEETIKVTIAKIDAHKKIMDNFVGSFLLNEG